MYRIINYDNFCIRKQKVARKGDSKVNRTDLYFEIREKAFGLKCRHESSLMGWLEVLENFRERSSMGWGPEAERAWHTAGPGGSVADVKPVREKVGKMQLVRDNAKI